MLYQGFYKADIDWIGEEVKKAKQRLKKANNIKPVYSGLFLPHLKKLEDIKKAIAVSKTNGAAGVSFFSYGNFTDDSINILKE